MKKKSEITVAEIIDELLEEEVEEELKENRILKVLVADDQRINLEVLKMNLEEAGFIKGTEFYVNGQQVIDRVKEFFDTRNKFSCPINALLLDFQMPIKNGL